MRIYNNIYIGHAETFNPDEKKLVEDRVVALKLAGYDKNKNPILRPIRKYTYYKLKNYERINGFITDKGIDRALRKTGKQEVKVLKKVA